MKRGYIPGQHGAWAMLIVPFLFGMFAARPVPLHALLFLAWLLVYLFSFPFLQWLRTGKADVYAKPVFIYGGLLVPVGVLLAASAPALFRLAPLFVPMFVVNAVYAARNRERALFNDLAAVIQFSLIVFVAHQAGGGGNGPLAVELFAISVLYFTGTVFHVKTIIRERGNITYYRMSVGYHLALLAAGIAWWHPALTAPLAILLARAVISPRTKMTVRQSGMLEIAYSAMTALTVLIGY